jgi:hypothetical protein
MLRFGNNAFEMGQECVRRDWEGEIMKTRLLAVAVGASAMALASLPAWANGVGLFEYAFNIDGTVSDNFAPAEADITGFDTGTGLGTISVSVGGAGSHYVSLFVDHEIDEADNTFYNENGDTSGSAAAGQTWEIDEPGYVFGDIYDNFLASELDDMNALPAGSEDDVSMAQGWDFALAAGETAEVNFVLASVQPSGFYLSHTDPDSNTTFYFSSSVDISPSGVVPIPGAVWLFGTALVGLGALGRRFRTVA